MTNNYKTRSKRWRNPLSKLILTCLAIMAFMQNANAQTTHISSLTNGGFELGASLGANSWTVVNDINHTWQVGSASTPAAGTNAAFISNDGGVSYGYSNIVTQTSHFYKDITVPAGETKISLSFLWKNAGESGWDRVLVYIAPTTFTPTAGSPVSNSTAMAGATLISPLTYHSQTTYQAANISLSPALAGTTFRLIFTWQNDDAAGANPPASIDNINLVSSLPGDYISVTSGDWNLGSTWDIGSVPTALDNAIISAGHIVTLTATGLAINDLTVNGTLVYGPTPTSFVVNKDLVVSGSGLFNVFNGTTGKTLNVAGNLTNNGTMDFSVGTGVLVLNGSTTQTVNGTGSLTLNRLATLTFNNTATNPIINWNWNNIQVTGTLNFTRGWVNLGAANTLTLGNNTPSAGTLSITNGGFMNGTFSRWWTAAGTGTALTAGSDPTTTTSRYPFVNASGINRSIWIQRVTPSGATGTIGFTYSDASTITPVSVVDAGTYTVGKRFDANWTFSGTVPTTGTYNIAVVAPGAYPVLNGNSRVLLAAAAAGGTHRNGTTTPGAQRGGLTYTDLTSGALYIGAASADVPTCFTPTGLTISSITSSSAVASWTNPASGVPTNYNLEVRTSGLPGSGAVGLVGTYTVSHPTNTTTIVGLTDASTYSAYVRTDCGAGDYSVWSAAANFTTLCNPVAVFSENFDAVTTPAFPVCFGKVGAPGTSNTQTTNPNSGPNCLYIYSTATGPANMAVVALKPVSNAGAGTHQLRFSGRANFTVGGVIEVGYLTNPADPLSFVPVQPVTFTALTYQQYTVMLGTAPGANQTLAFRHTGAPANSVLVDDIFWEPIPSIDVAAGALVTPSSIGCYSAAESVSVTVTNNGVAPLNLAVDPLTLNVYVSGAVVTTLTNTFSSGTIAVGATATYTIANLNMSSSGVYSFTVNANVVGDGAAFNNTSAVYTRTVLANQALPQAVNFTGFTGTNLTTVFPNWKESTGATIPTGTTSAWTSSTLIAGSGTTAKINLFTNTRNEWIVGPKVTASAITRMRYKIAITDYNLGTADPAGMQGTDDAVFLKVSTDCGASWTTLSTYNAANTVAITNSLVEYTLNLGAYAGQNIMLAFHAIDGPVDDGPDYDFHIDDITIEETPVCNPISSLFNTSLTTTSAVLTWTNGGSETQWHVEYGPTPYVFTGTPTATFTTNPSTLTALTANTSYDVQVRAYCGVGSESPWSSSITFVTPCAASSIPYTQNFDAATVPAIPSCTSIQDVNGNTTWITETGIVNYTGNVLTYKYNTPLAANDWFYTNGLNLTGGTSYLLNYKYGARSATYPEALEIKYGTSANAAAMTTGLATHTNIITQVNTNQVIFTPGSNGIYYIGFHANSAPDMWDLYLDEINVTIAPTLDIKAETFNTPNASGCYSATENVSVVVSNAGTNPINFATNNLTLNVYVSGSATTTLTTTINTGTLPASGFATYTVGTVNMSAVGSYSFTGMAFIATEVPTGNNNFAPIVRNVFPTVGVPYTENFESYASASVPPTWDGEFDWQVLSNHGTAGSNGYTTNVYSSNLQDGSSTRFKIGPVTATTSFTVDYRLVDYTGYPSTATALTASDYCLIGISTDCGANWIILKQIDNVSHTPTTSFTTSVFDLSSYAGQNVMIGLQGVSGGVSDYYFDIDNIGVIQPLNGNSTLSNLTSSVGSLSPTFVSSTTNYTVTLPFGSSGAATLTPTLATTLSTITSNTSATNVAGTSPANVATVVVTAQNGSTSTYTVTYNIAPANTNSSLSALTTSVGTLSPTFASGTFNYTITLPFGSSGAATLTPTLATTLSTITSNTGASNVAGTAPANVATVVVTAQSGATSTYTVTYNVTPANTNSSLSALTTSVGTLSPTFASGTFNYTVTLPFGSTGAATLTPTRATTLSTITSNVGATNVAGTAPANVATVVVTAQSGATSTYTVTYNVTPGNSNANLSNLVPSAGSLSPVFASGTYNYTVTLPSGTVGGATVTPTLADITATITSNTGATDVTTAPNNVATVIVTAQNGTTTATYTVTFNVSPAVNNDATLASLSSSVGTLSPAFASGTTNYTVTLPFGTTGGSTLVAATTNGSATTVITSATNVAGTAPANTATVVVTAQDGITTSTYTVVYSVAAPSTNAALSNLVPSMGTLSPAFAAGTFSYTVSLAAGTTGGATVTPTLADVTATSVITSATNVAGAAPANTATVVVTAQDGTTTATYTVVFSAPVLSSDATLSGLTSSVGSLSPAFASGTTNYTITLPFGSTGSATLTPTTSNAGATTVVTAATDVTAAAPANTATVVVTAEDGITTATYTVVYSVAASISNDASLSALNSSVGTLSPAFATGTFNYTVTLPFGSTGGANLTYTTSNAFATVVVTSATNVNGSSPANTATVVVTAEDGITTATYTVVYSVSAPSTNASLSNLTTSVGTLSPAFAGGTFNYTVTLPFGSTGAATLTATTADVNATTVITNATNVAGTAPANTATVVVTAQDGTTTATYTVVYSVTPASTDASLSSLSSSVGTLNPAFATGTFNYTIVLPAGSTGGATVTAVTNNPGATVVITHATNVAGTAPSNTATVVVTAQDGTTTATYTIVYSVSVGISEVDANSVSVDVYPNPTSGMAEVKVIDNKSTVINISVVSLSGQLIAEKEITTNGLEVSHQIDLTKQPKGVYFVKVIGATGTQTKRVITY